MYRISEIIDNLNIWRFAQIMLYVGGILKLVNFGIVWKETHACSMNDSIMAYS